MHTYAFGSICRGEISLSSDIDLLAIVENYNSNFNPDVFSIYSYKRIQELWLEGNPFAWHLFCEARLLFSSSGVDYLKSLESPQPYKKCVQDCEKFSSLSRESHASIAAGSNCKIFDLSTIFLSIRNIATCYSIGVLNKPDFSRNSALNLSSNSVPLSQSSYGVLERARILCTRGYGNILTESEILNTLDESYVIQEWMDELIREARIYERV